MQARSLNRNSWHFWLAKKLNVVHVHGAWNDETNEWVEGAGELEDISVCEYVRGLILKGLLAFVTATLLLVLAASAIGAPLIWLILGDPMLLHFGIFKMLGFLGTVLWGSALCIGAAFTLVFFIAAVKERIQNWLRNKPKAPEKTEGFGYMVKSVYKSKICYQLK